MWNAKPPAGTPAFVTEVPSDTAAMLKEIAETHLVQLDRNAEAYGAGASHFDMTVQGTAYKRLPVSRYRVWCLEMLREAFAALTAEEQKCVRALLPHAPAEILWRDAIPAKSGYDEAREAPFNKAINVYGTGIPR
jgi:hypothetical protein